MKKYFAIGGLIVAGIILGALGRTFYPRVITSPHIEEINQLRDSISILHVRDSILFTEIQHNNIEIVALKDSIRWYKVNLYKTKVRYEKYIAGMFNWSDDEHILFFSAQTDSIKRLDLYLGSDR